MVSPLQMRLLELGLRQERWGELLLGDLRSKVGEKSRETEMRGIFFFGIVMDSPPFEQLCTLP